MTKMAINNDFESLLDAMTDEGSDENDQFLALAERRFLSAYGELEPFINRVGVLARNYRKWYKAYLLGGGRPQSRYDEMLQKVEPFRHLPSDVLSEVRASQATLPVPPRPVVVETPFGSEVVQPPRPEPVRGIIKPPEPEPPRTMTYRAGDMLAAKALAASIPDEDVAAFYNLVVEKFGRPPTGRSIAEHFGLSENWANQKIGHLWARKLIKVVRKRGEGYGPKDLTDQILLAFGKYEVKKGGPQ